MGSAESQEQINEVVAAALGVENPKEAVANSQKVMHVADDTDLEAAARFDVDAWMEESGIADAVPASTPKVFFARELKKTYSLPSPKKFDSRGGFSVGMSGPVQVIKDPMKVFLGLGLRDLRSLKSDD